MGLFGPDAPKFLGNGAIYTQLREVITSAEERLLIVSPFIEPNDDFIRELESASMVRKVEVSVIFRRDKLREYSATRWLKSFEAAKISLGTVERLHSKLYVSERSALLGSMNFYGSSGENSFESGVLFDKGDKILAPIHDYLVDLKRHVEPVTATGPLAERTARAHRGVNPARRSVGFCIRCADEIPLNPKRPYCDEDYEKWARFKNENYEDKRCHSCGSAFGATMREPVCRKCAA